MNALDALKAANFDWVMRLDDVWREAPHDVTGFNAELKAEIIAAAEKMGETSPLGRVLLGPAGAGKTHLLGSLRREAMTRGMTFILVDLTDVKDFWQTVLLGFLNSLREPDGHPQCRKILENILRLLGMAREKAERSALLLARAPAGSLKENTGRIIKALAARHRKKTIEHQDVIRALFMLNSEDFTLGNAGYNFLQGLELGPEETGLTGMRQPRRDPVSLIRGLTWLAGLGGPVILAIDQLDAIVSEQHIAASGHEEARSGNEQAAARGIIESLGRGLSALADHTYRTLSVISCLESTWHTLRLQALASSTDRFDAPRQLQVLTRLENLSDMVATRMAPAFMKAGFSPPYPTWPFQPSALRQAAGLTPRELLKRCETHRRHCLEQGRPVELASLDGQETGTESASLPNGLEKIDHIFETLKKKAEPAAFLDEEQEDTLGALLQTVCRLLIRETPLPDDIDVLLETRFGGGKAYPPLHARLSLVFVAMGGEETHICLRALQKLNANAYIARLQAALTASGIDAPIHFRRLFVFRNHPEPAGPKSREITAEFRKAGGRFIELDDHGFRTLWALNAMEDHPPAGFEEWIFSRRPLSSLEFVKTVFPELSGFSALPEAHRHRARPKRNEKTTPPAEAVRTAAQPPLVIGKSSADGQEAEILFPATALARHSVILAAPGAGGVRLARLLAEQSVLAGVPVVVFDTSGKLATLGDAQSEYKSGAMEHAARYLGKADVRVLAPGPGPDRGLGLPPLPDFSLLPSSSQGYAETLADLIVLGKACLMEKLSGVRAGKQKKMAAVLDAAFQLMADRGGSGLAELFMILENFPRDAGSGVRSAVKVARETGLILKSRLGPSYHLRRAESADGAEAFFPAPDRDGRVRVSVITGFGSEKPDHIRDAAGVLLAAVYSRFRKQPPSAGQLNGLLILNDASMFVPRKENPPCKAALLTLAGIGRRHGLGMVLVSGEPKLMDHAAMRPFANWFFGRAVSPASVSAMRSLMAERGCGGADPAGLEAGRFWAAAGQFKEPVGFIPQPCLTIHPPHGLPDEDIIARASGRDG